MSINRRMDKKDVHYIYDRILLSRKKKNKILSFVTTLMDLERIILSKSEKDKHHVISLMWNLKHITKELICKTGIDSQT